MRRAAFCLALAALWGCRTPRAKTVLEVFVLSQAAEPRTIAFVKRGGELVRESPDPDSVARALIAGDGDPAVLHSTSWRWERDGTIVLTYLAYCEPAAFRAVSPLRLRYDALAPPPSTDPQHPRPPEIRDTDVLAHGIRHLSFLVRHASDGRIGAALSPRSRLFFQSMCGQLAGRLESAREFEECSPPR